MRKYICTWLSLAIATAMMAVPANPRPYLFTQANGEEILIQQHGDEFYHWTTNAQGETIELGEDGNYHVVEAVTEEQAGIRRAQSTKKAHRAQKEIGEPNLAPRGLVILVNFTDSKFKSTNNLVEMDSMLNAITYTYEGAYGSMRQYFIDQSDGQYQPQFDVVGPVELNHTAAYYGTNTSSGNDRYTADFVIESVLAADEQVDFSLYDNDQDGMVDFIYLLYAGKGEADGGASSTIWPHNWDVTSALYYGLTNQSTYYYKSDTKYKLPTPDGKMIYTYACSAEQNGANGKRTGIGTICHEFSHVLGLPDYYDTMSGGNDEKHMYPQGWDLMASGNYNGDSKYPAGYSIHEKWWMGWQTPTVLNEPENVTLEASKGGRYITYKGLPLASASATDTTYYIENRQQTGWDTYLPGHGMIVWKVMYNESIWDNNSPNDTDEHPRYNIYSASGSYPRVLENEQDPFPGSGNVTTFAPYELYPCTEITETLDGELTFKFMGGIDNPGTDIRNTSNDQQAKKLLINGQLMIQRGDILYNVLGY